MAEFDRPVRPGDVLAGKYRVERVLGEGGMGWVVQATHLALEQLVAVKFVQPSMLDSKMIVERFLREARAAVKLRSEHVARVLDVGTLASGAPYMVMEFLDGRDLAEVVLREGPLPVDRAVDYVAQACEAIAEAHSLGIVHRDIKPQNLFLTTRVGGEPLVKVLDFGISKVTSEAAAGLTQSQATVGSPLYMAPEQMRSAKDVDGRADIWALGVVLYKLLSGQVPFEAETMPALCYKVVHDPPRPLAEVRPDVPEGVLRIVERCLEKDPAKRFGNVGELAAALEPLTPMRARGPLERARYVTGGMRGSLPAIHEVVPLTPVAASTPPPAPTPPPGTMRSPATPDPASPRAIVAGPPSQQSSPSNPAIDPTRPSGIPMAPPVGTQSSWAGTHGGKERPAWRLPVTVAGATALVAIVGFVGLRATAHAPPAAPAIAPLDAALPSIAPVASPTANSAPTAPPSATPAEAAAPAPRPSASPSASALVNPNAPPSTVVLPSPSAVSAPPRPTHSPSQPSQPSPRASSSAPRPDDDIPSLR